MFSFHFLPKRYTHFPLNGIFLRSVSMLLLVLYFAAVKADDPGISKVRLIQNTENSYTFETDISEALLWTLRTPVFPERFELSEPVYTNQSGWVTISLTATTEEEPLSPEDEILLPWTRNAADMTVQWIDGDIHKGLYQRSLNGIHIPLKELMPLQKTTKEVFIENYRSGLKHFPFKGVHLLLVFALVLLAPGLRSVKLLFAYSMGQMSAMLLVGLNIQAFDVLYSDMLLVLTVFLIAFRLAYNKGFKHLQFVLLFAGLIHGMAYASELTGTGLPYVQRIQALFAFNLAIDTGHYVLAFIFTILLKPGRLPALSGHRMAVITGSLSVLIMLLISYEHVITGKTNLFQQEASRTTGTYQPAAKSPAATGGNVQRGAGMMTTPVMVFLSVEPFELRQEILVSATAANAMLGFNQADAEKIPVESQEKIKEGVLDIIVSNDSLLVDNLLLKSAEQSINFVTLSRGGVAIRSNPVEEDMGSAILGLTLIYDIESFPDSIQSPWKVFPEGVETIEFSAVDPHGVSSYLLSAEDNLMQWKSKLAGYKVPAIEPIEVRRPEQPVLSWLLWLVLIVLLIYSYFKHRSLLRKPLLTALLLIGFICYPFVRITVDIPFLSHGKPSEEKGGVILNQLLSNVYRAFDRRLENDVYDRLSLSVTDRQLRDIYIQNRQSMALENRGGARANVDEVQVENIHGIKRNSREGYTADTEWTVRGSVNHFGHTHYRQNQYRALVTFAVIDGTWKINNFEILDTRRLY